MTSADAPMRWEMYGMSVPFCACPRESEGLRAVRGAGIFERSGKAGESGRFMAGADQLRVVRYGRNRTSAGMCHSL